MFISEKIDFKIEKVFMNFTSDSHRGIIKYLF